MAFNDPATKAMLRMEVRRFTSRCDADQALLQRADTLREVVRLANRPVPSMLSGENDAREAQRRLVQAAEERARELIMEHLNAYGKAHDEQRDRLMKNLADDLVHLTGPLGHLRTWAQNKRTAAEQMF